MCGKLKSDCMHITFITHNSKWNSKGELPADLLFVMTFAEPTIRDAYVVSWISLVCTVIAFFCGETTPRLSRLRAYLSAPFLF